jgi:hypothetical protein
VQQFAAKAGWGRNFLGVARTHPGRAATTHRRTAARADLALVALHTSGELLGGGMFNLGKSFGFFLPRHECIGAGIALRGKQRARERRVTKSRLGIIRASNQPRPRSRGPAIAPGYRRLWRKVLALVEAPDCELSGP